MKRVMLPALACALIGAVPRLFAQEWIPLQDGKSLAGWKAPERPESWEVEDGAFVTRGDRSHLYYVGKVGGHDFRNFELSAEVWTDAYSNGGIYVHTKLQPEGWPAAGYELQVINSNPPAEKMNGYIEHKMTGSIYAIRNTWAAPANNHEWFSYRIRVVGKTIQTFINDKLICEYAEPVNPWRPDDKKGRLLSSGTFALQAHDPGSTVKYRNLRVKILSNNAAPPVGLVPIEDREFDELVTRASNDNIPLIDSLLPPHADSDEAFWSELRRYGVTLGSEFGEKLSQSEPPDTILIIQDTDRGPDVELLKAAKAAGAKVVFSSSGLKFMPSRLKTRLIAIRAAGLGWKDFWVPGKQP